MKRIFEIEFPNELGEMWMNQDNLMLCINAYCENKDGKIKATDVTDKVAYLSEDQKLPKIPFNYEDECGEYTAYSKGQQDMLKQVWRKVEM